MTRVRRTALAAALLLAVLATTALSALAVWSTRPASEGELDRAAAMAAADAARPILAAAVEDCRARPAVYGLPRADDVGRACAEAVAPEPAWYLGRPPLDAGAVGAYDVLLLGLALTAAAGLAGLALGGADAWGAGRVVAASLGAGAAIGALGVTALWSVAALALAVRGLETPDAGVLLQICRAGLLTAAACAVSAIATRRLGSAAWTVLLLGAGAALTLWLPVDVLDVAGAWLTWDAL